MFQLWRLFGIAAFFAVTSGALAAHKGAILDIVEQSGTVYSISNAGLVQGVGNQGCIILQPPAFRLFGLAASPMGKEHVYFCGGEPGVSGVVGTASKKSDGRWQMTETPLGDDVIYDVALSPQNDRLAVGCADGKVFLFEINDGTLGAPSLHYAHTAMVRSVAFSPNGKYVASGGWDGLVLVAETASRTTPVPLQDHSDKVECVAFAADSERIFSGARDGRVRLHTVEGRLIRTYVQKAGNSSTSAWTRENPVLSLARTGRSEGMLAGTASGYIIELSATDTSIQTLETFSHPVNALCLGQRSWAGTDQVLPVLD